MITDDRYGYFRCLHCGEARSAHGEPPKFKCLFDSTFFTTASDEVQISEDPYRPSGKFNQMAQALRKWKR